MQQKRTLWTVLLQTRYDWKRTSFTADLIYSCLLHAGSKYQRASLPSHAKGHSRIRRITKTPMVRGKSLFLRRYVGGHPPYCRFSAHFCLVLKHLHASYSLYTRAEYLSIARLSTPDIQLARLAEALARQVTCALYLIR